MQIDRDKAREIISAPAGYSYEELFAAADAIMDDPIYLEPNVPQEEIYGSVDGNYLDKEIDKLWRSDSCL